VGGATSQLHHINHNKVVVISSDNLHANCSNCIILGQILFHMLSVLYVGSSD